MKDMQRAKARAEQASAEVEEIIAAPFDPERPFECPSRMIEFFDRGGNG